MIELEENQMRDLRELDGYKLVAYPIVHKVPCFAYIIEEPERTGQLDAKKAATLGEPSTLFKPSREK